MKSRVLFFILFASIFFSCIKEGSLLSRLDELKKKDKWQIVFSSGGTTLYLLEFNGADKPIYSNKDNFIINPSLTRDGKEIIFTTIRIGEKTSDINTIDSEGVNIQKLFSFPYAKGTSMSPDGKTIAFWGDYNEIKKSKNLYLYNIDEEKIRLMQNDATYAETAFAPSWSPDSKQIVYASLDGHITIFDVEKQSIKKLIKGDAPSWSPDGKTIIYREGFSYFRVFPEKKTTEYYIEGHNYYSIKPTGEGKTFIFNGESPAWDFAGHAYAPVVWSPDSKFILFFKPYDSLLTGPNKSKVYVIEIESGKTVFIKKQAGTPSFSWSSRL